MQSHGLCLPTQLRNTEQGNLEFFRWGWKYRNFLALDWGKIMVCSRGNIKFKFLLLEHGSLVKFISDGILEGKTPF